MFVPMWIFILIGLVILMNMEGRLKVLGVGLLAVCAVGFGGLMLVAFWDDVAEPVLVWGGIFLVIWLKGKWDAWDERRAGK